MKIIKYINTFAILIPFLAALFFLQFGIETMIYSLYFLMLTGFIQGILGIILFIKNPKDKFIKAYLIAVLLFFGLWYFNMNVHYLNFLTNFLIPIPLILAVYLSVLIYKRKQL
ncbi:hypothetical protein ACFPVY_09495 [Flavobacterium qiangtangense]|uniref:Uncharacterized protein n=1 Tax=Flavobacterium qiangtangense TaxID=1442595 RepID=A0ABW1PMT4_9FLAO